MNKEEWKVISDIGGLYSISNKGRVMRTVGGKRGATAGKILTPSIVGRGYKRVILHLKAKRIIKYVHTLVLEAFVGKRPNNHIANHKDGIKFNNCSKNLEWVTPSQNNKHALDNGLREPIRGGSHPLFGVPATDIRHPMFGKFGAKNPSAKLTQKQVNIIRKRYLKETQTSLAKEFNVTRWTIGSIVRKETWK